MRIENIGNMDFGLDHHGGMPSAKELRWRQQVERAGYEARYYPHGRPADKIPNLGEQLSDIGRVAISVGRTGCAWNQRMEGV